MIFSQVDLEEAKGQEIAKLQSALQDMQGQLDEAHVAIIREKEAAKLAIEQAPPVIKEVPVVDNSKVEELTLHNEKLEVISVYPTGYTFYHKWHKRYTIKRAELMMINTY